MHRKGVFKSGHGDEWDSRAHLASPQITCPYPSPHPEPSLKSRIQKAQKGLRVLDREQIICLDWYIETENNNQSHEECLWKVPHCSKAQAPGITEKWGEWKWKWLSRVLFLWPQGLYSPWNSPGQNTGVGSLSLLQGIFPTQGSNPGLLRCGNKGAPGKEWLHLLGGTFLWILVWLWWEHLVSNTFWVNRSKGHSAGSCFRQILSESGKGSQCHCAQDVFHSRQSQNDACG